MKTLICAVCVMLVCCTRAGAQSSPPLPATSQQKPALFADLPIQLNITTAQLDALLQLSQGNAVAINIDGRFPFTGTVVSKSKEGEPYQTIVIRSTNRQGAAFSISRTQAEGGGYQYRGRILSRQHADSFDVVRRDQQYYLIKRSTDELMTE
jgi:hypothetical protein